MLKDVIVFDLTPAELFLFLRDTELLKDLITRKKIQFSGVIDEADPSRRLLRAQGGGDKLQILTFAIGKMRRVSQSMSSVRGMLTSYRILRERYGG